MLPSVCLDFCGGEAGYSEDILQGNVENLKKKQIKKNKLKNQAQVHSCQTLLLGELHFILFFSWEKILFIFYHFLFRH